MRAGLRSPRRSASDVGAQPGLSCHHFATHLHDTTRHGLAQAVTNGRGRCNGCENRGWNAGELAREERVPGRSVGPKGRVYGGLRARRRLDGRHAQRRH